MTKLFVVGLFFILSYCALAQETASDSTQNNINLDADFRIEELNTKYAKANEDKPMKGYRIQLFSGNKTQAYEKRRLFVNSYPDIFSKVIYDVPSYKVQVGNFIYELEAQKCKQDILEGFPNALIIETDIDIPEYSLPEKTEEIEVTEEENATNNF